MSSNGADVVPRRQTDLDVVFKLLHLAVATLHAETLGREAGRSGPGPRLVSAGRCVDPCISECPRVLHSIRVYARCAGRSARVAYDTGLRH